MTGVAGFEAEETGAFEELNDLSSFEGQPSFMFPLTLATNMQKDARLTRIPMLPGTPILSKGIPGSANPGRVVTLSLTRIIIICHLTFANEFLRELPRSTINCFI